MSIPLTVVRLFEYLCLFYQFYEIQNLNYLINPFLLVNLKRSDNLYYKNDLDYYFSSNIILDMYELELKSFSIFPKSNLLSTELIFILD